MPILKREPDAFPETIFEMGDPWWVAHLKSRQEKVLARYLREHDVPFYLPQMEKRVRRSGRTFVSYLPLFSGYVFFRGGREEKLRALKSNVIVNVLEPADQTEISGELTQLRDLQLTDAQLVPHPFVGPGDTVLITTEDVAHYRQMRQRVDVNVEGVPVKDAFCGASGSISVPPFVAATFTDTAVQSGAIWIR